MRRSERLARRQKREANLGWNSLPVDVPHGCDRCQSKWMDQHAVENCPFRELMDKLDAWEAANPEPPDPVRELFEKWRRGACKYSEPHLNRERYAGRYKYHDIQQLWEGFQAGYAIR